ncbi:PhoPQ-activated protein PqaA family protein [Maioricimonas sp. JC845]|uniref:PhoPQ-activated protein PqaA family protein n=1 Tax=Maioricimonas sp. JC845 TaxID=3232138 RepID=UPI003457D5CA
MLRLLLTLMLLPLTPSCARASEPKSLPDLFPKSEMRDASTLDLTVEPMAAGTLPESVSVPYQAYRVEFTSFEWSGETWRHRAVAILPEQRDERFGRGGVIVSGPQGGNRRLAAVCIEMGLPVLLITGGNPGGRYGAKNEGGSMAVGSRRFLETGDPRWLGYGWLAKVLVRSITAAQAVPGFDADRFVVTGGSKRGLACWIATAVDDRIVGAFPTNWNAGNLTEWIRNKIRRWGNDYQPNAKRQLEGPAFVSSEEQLERLNSSRGKAGLGFIDPFHFRQRFEGKHVLYTVGTNDPLFPPTSDGVFLPKMSGDIRILLIPNTGHNNNTEMHRTAWRMWLAHSLAGRGVPTISLNKPAGETAPTVTGRIASTTTITAARIWTASDRVGAYQDAEWTALPVDVADDGTFSVELPASEDDHRAFFVQVVDESEEFGSGTITTRMHEWSRDSADKGDDAPNETPPEAPTDAP